MKPPAYYKGKEQTYLKHFFLERYLEAVAFHIGYAHREFVFVDCFSGPWHAADEALADTSIRIALDKLNYVRNGLAAQHRYANIRAIFVEKDPIAFRMPSIDTRPAPRGDQNHCAARHVRGQHLCNPQRSRYGIRVLLH